MWLFFASLSAYLGYRLVRQGAVLQETRRHLYLITGPTPAWGQVQPAHNGYAIALCPNCHREM